MLLWLPYWRMQSQHFHHQVLLDSTILEVLLLSQRYKSSTINLLLLSLTELKIQSLPQMLPLSFILFVNNFVSSFILHRAWNYNFTTSLLVTDCEFLMGKQMGSVITAQYYLFSCVAFCYSYHFILSAFLNKKLL